MPHCLFPPVPQAMHLNLHTTFCLLAPPHSWSTHPKNPSRQPVTPLTHPCHKMCMSSHHNCVILYYIGLWYRIPYSIIDIGRSTAHTKQHSNVYMLASHTKLAQSQETRRSPEGTYGAFKTEPEGTWPFSSFKNTYIVHKHEAPATYILLLTVLLTYSVHNGHKMDG